MPGLLRDDIAQQLMARRGGGGQMAQAPQGGGGGQPWAGPWFMNPEIAAAQKRIEADPDAQYFANKGVPSGSATDVGWMNTLQPWQGGVTVGGMPGNYSNPYGMIGGASTMRGDPNFWGYSGPGGLGGGGEGVGPGGVGGSSPGGSPGSTGAGALGFSGGSSGPAAAAAAGPAAGPSASLGTGTLGGMAPGYGGFSEGPTFGMTTTGAATIGAPSSGLSEGWGLGATGVSPHGGFGFGPGAGDLGDEGDTGEGESY